MSWEISGPLRKYRSSLCSRSIYSVFQRPYRFFLHTGSLSLVIPVGGAVVPIIYSQSNASFFFESCPCVLKDFTGQRGEETCQK